MMPNQVGRMSKLTLSGMRTLTITSMLLAGLLMGITGCAGRNLAVPASANARRAESVDTAALDRIHEQYQAGNLQAAYDAVQKQRRDFPYSWEVRITEACIAADLGRTDEAIQAWRAIAALQPKSAKVQHETGMRLVQLGEAPAGIPALKRAVENDPENMKYRLDLAAAHVASGNPHIAQVVLVQAHQEYPDETVMPVAIARLFENQNNFSRAAYYYGVALKQSPDNPTLLRQRGRMWFRLGKYELARVDLAACEETLIEGKHWPALLEYGRACLNTGDAKSARRIAAAFKERPDTLSPEVQQFALAAASAPEVKLPESIVPALMPPLIATSAVSERSPVIPHVPSNASPKAPPAIRQASAVVERRRPPQIHTAAMPARETPADTRNVDTMTAWRATNVAAEPPQVIDSTAKETAPPPNDFNGWKPTRG